MTTITKRKYIYHMEYEVQGLYFGSWECETSEETYKEALLRLKEYRQNRPEYAYRIKIITTKELK